MGPAPARAYPAPHTRGGSLMSQFAQRHASRRSQQLAERAARMRAQATPSEALLWSRLRCRQLGVEFRRQVVVADRYIVDFLAPAAGLVVEVDGGYHAQRRAADARRQRALERAGYRVLRVEAAQVMEQLPGVVAAIRAAVGQ